VKVVVVESHVVDHSVATSHRDVFDEAIMFSRRSPISICSRWAADAIEVFAAVLAFSIASASAEGSTRSCHGGHTRTRS
jgi:hypothetical protein